MSASRVKKPPGPPRIVVIISSSEDEEMAASTARQARVHKCPPRSNSAGEPIVISSEEEGTFWRRPLRHSSSTHNHHKHPHHGHHHHHHHGHHHHHRDRHHSGNHRYNHNPHHHHSRSPSSPRSPYHGRSHSDPIILSPDNHKLKSSPRRPRPTYCNFSSHSLSPTLPRHSLTHSPHSRPWSPLTHRSSSPSSPYQSHNTREKLFSECSQSLGKHSRYGGCEPTDDAVSAKRQRVSPCHGRCQVNCSPSNHSKKDGTQSQESKKHSSLYCNGHHYTPPGVSSPCATSGTVPVKLEHHVRDDESPPLLLIKQECLGKDERTPPPPTSTSLGHSTTSLESHNPPLATTTKTKPNLSLKKMGRGARNVAERASSTSDNERVRRIVYDEIKQKRNGITDNGVLMKSPKMERGNEIPMRKHNEAERRMPRSMAERDGARTDKYLVNTRDSTPEMSPHQRRRKNRLPSGSQTSSDGRNQQTLGIFLCNGDTTLKKTTPTFTPEHPVRDEKSHSTCTRRDTTPPLPHNGKTPPKWDCGTITALPQTQPPSSAVAALCPLTPPPATYRTCTSSSVTGKPSTPLSHCQLQLSRVSIPTSPRVSTPTPTSPRVFTPTTPTPTSPQSATPDTSTLSPARKGATAISTQQSLTCHVRTPTSPLCAAPHTSSASSPTVTAEKRATQVAPVEVPVSLIPSWSDSELDMRGEPRVVPANEAWIIPGSCVSGQTGATLTSVPAATCSWNYVEVYMKKGDEAKFVDALEDIITTGHYIPDGHVNATLEKVLCISDCSLLLRLHSILDTDANIRPTIALNARVLCELIEDCCRTLCSSTNSTHKSSSSHHPHSAHVVLLYLVTLLEADVARHKDTLSAALLECTLSLTTQWRRVGKIIDLILELLLHPKQQLLPLPDLPPVLAALLCMCISTSRETDREDGTTRLARELSSQLSKLPSVKLKTDLLLLIPCHLLREKTISIHLQTEFLLPTSSPSLPSEHVTLDLISTCHLHRLPYRPDGSTQDLLFFLSLLYYLLFSHCSQLLGLSPNTTPPPAMLPDQLAQVLQPLAQLIRRLPRRLSEDDGLLLELTSPHCWFYLQLLESIFIWDH